MTLDLSSLIQDLDELGKASERQNDGARYAALGRAFATVDSTELQARLRTAKTSWLLATGTQALNLTMPRIEAPADYAVVASDGSFILPDRHSPTRFFVINIGKVLLRYGSSPTAELTSSPTMYFREDELYVPNAVRRVPIDGTVLGLKRAADELRAVAETAIMQPRPVLALQDGTLILWALESQPDFVASWVLEPYLETMRALRDASVPVAAFISFPGSSDVMNSLRVSVCDYPDQGLTVNCDHCRSRIEPEGHSPACDVLPDVVDRTLFEQVARLQPGERSAVFASSSKILRQYEPDFWVHFFYLHTGGEIARVEIPRWVAADRELLDFCHGVIADQCERGRGYPTALQEAHELAAIQPSERRSVELLVEEALARHGIVLRRSAKAESKRGRFV